MTSPNDSDRTSQSEERQANQLRGWYALAGVGFEFIAAILVCGGAGWWLDGYFGTKPWLLISGAGLGFAVGLWMMLKAANRSFKDKS
jgi:F0F1-type ATP synthase assembly protein I